jgi:CheY-like chemotaxis protein
MSGYAMSEDRKAGLAVGMSGYVSKPLKHAELLELMVQALSRD